MPTIYDIAAAAGVSHSTVSRVVNGKGYVSQSARERVNKAIEELGYRPNELARGLAGGRTKTIAAIVPDVANPFFTTAVRGVEDIASGNGYSVILCNTDEDVEKEKEYIKLILGKQIDGVVLASAGPDASHLAQLVDKRIKVVLLDRKLPGFETDCVRGDSRNGAAQAISYLVNRGHVRIALFAGPLRVDAMRNRLEGYRSALESAGLTFDENLVFEGPPFLEYGRSCMDKALAMANPPTAVLCTSNFIGIGALDRLRQRTTAGPSGRPPIEVVAFDFDGVMSYAARESAALVGLVNQPAYQLGVQAMELLMTRMTKRKPDHPSDVVLPAVFESTCSPEC